MHLIHHRSINHGMFLVLVLLFSLGLMALINQRIVFINDRVEWLPRNVIKRPINYKKLQSPLFKENAEQICKILHCEPIDLLSIMVFETLGSLSSHQKRIGPGRGIGLLQFTPATAKSLGTSMLKMDLMGDKKQLNYVSKYLLSLRNGRGGNFNNKLSLQDLYMFVFYPAAIQKEEDFILFKETQGNVYRYNQILDSNKKGFITKRDAASRVALVKQAILKKKPYLFVEMLNGMQFSLFTDLAEYKKIV